MRTGTSYFNSFMDAVAYYKPYEGSYKAATQAVERKLRGHEIHIGRPSLKPGERLLLDIKEGRYFIES